VCVYAIASFDLWMPKGAHDIFALLMFFGKFCMLKKITIGLFKPSKTLSQTLTRNYSINGLCCCALLNQCRNLSKLTKSHT
jgi:hypothetical protein